VFKLKEVRTTMETDPSPVNEMHEMQR